MTGTITSHSTCYYFNDLAQISYSNWKPSGQWKIVGAIRYNNFGREVERIPFKELGKLNGKWQHANGKQKWHLMDYDHGTNRVWMNPNHTVIVN